MQDQQSIPTELMRLGYRDMVQGSVVFCRSGSTGSLRRGLEHTGKSNMSARANELEAVNLLLS